RRVAAYENGGIDRNARGNVRRRLADRAHVGASSEASRARAQGNRVRSGPPLGRADERVFLGDSGRGQDPPILSRPLPGRRQRCRSDDVLCRKRRWPSLRASRAGPVPVQGNDRTNIILRGVAAHNFSPFLDRSPEADEERRYKAVGGVGTGPARLNRGKLFALASADGIHWSYMQEEPIMTGGGFDSHYIAFWDDNSRRYILPSGTTTAGDTDATTAISTTAACARSKTPFRRILSSGIRSSGTNMRLTCRKSNSIPIRRCSVRGPSTCICRFRCVSCRTAV
ncbi:MAG: hypothetical protein K0Q94_4010, partial [Paenibacillus sp.]|nr:hypothetical protein [Paenibacillus sp.]